MFSPKLSDKSPEISSFTIDKMAAHFDKMMENVLNGRSVAIIRSGSNNTIQPYSNFNLKSAVQNWIDNHSSIQPYSRFNIKTETLKWIKINKFSIDGIHLKVNELFYVLTPETERKKKFEEIFEREHNLHYSRMHPLIDLDGALITLQLSGDNFFFQILEDDDMIFI
jgi:hypothetical protein